MARFAKILEEKSIISFLKSRNLLQQYRKAKTYLLEGNVVSTRFKERNPKGSGVWYFRINKKYRALCVFNDEGDLIVFKIDDHQN